jgi:superfamily I DNA/RNA helicase
MINIIRNRNLTRVGILVPMNTKQTAANSHDTYSHISVEYVKEYLDAHGMPSEAKMSSDTTDMNELDFQSPTPKILTWTSAKGLQFNDVFIPFCENLFEEQRRKTLYVAITRAWNRLYIGYTGHINTAFFPLETSDCYEQMTTLDKI